MLGRSFDELQNHKKRWSFAVVDNNGEPAVEVRLKDQTTRFTPEEVTSLMIKRMKETAEGTLDARPPRRRADQPRTQPSSVRL